MFKKIEKFAYYLVDKYIEGDSLEIEKCKYSMHGILSFLFSGIFAILLAFFIFGYSYYVFFIIGTILWLRSMSAGAHAQSPRMCFIFTNINYILIGLSILYLSEYYLILFVLSFSAFTYLKDIPRYTKNAAKHKIEKQQLFRKKYILRLLILFVINICLIILLYNDIQFIWVLNFKKISILISGCILMNRFSLTNFSFWLLEKLK